MRSIHVLGLVVTAFAAVGCAGGGSGNSESSSDTLTVVYEATGTGKASSITYNESGSVVPKSVANVQLPWKKEVKVDKDVRTSFSVTAESAVDDEGNITRQEVSCKLTVDGKAAATKTDPIIATCERMPS
ncbi:hypothetical protein NLX83_37605 [Allokutzneria sp. A3M-2-11 16]|uniref:hypothetical protein n=1 Tax=Allokutzneria sp. A3M-2-11 16 TaxID=2962043 RepID=UPI0020B64497|nr:hypothetical protein [Allokutzneria sp. A3M-2-11 16]MCP3804999.1 hypothetical protein [Allokutzneria sp. A3M-2-11 16]